MVAIRRMFYAALLSLSVAGLGLPRSGLAGDAAQLEILGFSEDGRYFAYEQFGNADGTGAAYSWIDFYDVANGRYADETKRILVGGREGDDVNLEPTRASARRLAAETLDALGIRIGNVGENLVYHPLTDLGADSTTARFSVGTPLKGFQSQDYSLELEQEPVPSKHCYFGEQAYAYNLHLIDNRKNERTLFHADDDLPEERHCALAYRIAAIVAYQPMTKPEVKGTRIVVFVNVFSTGFEGHDMRYTAAGGTLH